tara:strand:- start:44 stop:907 length:864 start_codon:yes stop_codon:yes gene_type:complete
MREEQGKGNDKALDKAIGQFVIDYAESYMQMSISADVASDIFMNQNNRNPLKPKPIWNEKDDFDDKFFVGLKYALDNMGPGIYGQVNDVLWSLETDDEAFDRYGKTMPFIRSLARLTGFSTSEINPDLSMPFIRARRVDEFNVWVRENFNEEYISKGALPPEKILKDYDDLQRAWFEVQQDFYFELQALKAWDIDPDVYDAQLELFVKNTRAGDDFIDNIEQGIFTPWKIYDSYEESFNEKTEENNLDRFWPDLELDYKYDTLEYSRISLTANQELNRDYSLNQSVP